MITFDLPDHRNRLEIAAQYAKHLKEAELAEFAAATQGWVSPLFCKKPLLVIAIRNKF